MSELNKQELRTLVVCIANKAEKSRCIQEIESLRKLKGKLLSTLSILNCDRTASAVQLKITRDLG